MVVCEQLFSWLFKFAPITKYMNRRRFLFLVLYLLENHNRDVELEGSWVSELYISANDKLLVNDALIFYPRSCEKHHTFGDQFLLLSNQARIMSIYFKILYFELHYQLRSDCPCYLHFAFAISFV